MILRLAVTFKLLPSELTARLLERDLDEWRAYEALFGRLGGQQLIENTGWAALSAAAQGGMTIDPALLIPWHRAAEQTPEQMDRVIRGRGSS